SFQAAFKFVPAPDIVQNPQIQLYEDRTGEMWVISGTAINFGLAALNRKTRAFTIYSFPRDRPDAARPIINLTSICEDRAGALWLGTTGSGLIKFDSQKRTFVRYMSKPGIVTSLSNDFLVSLFRDREGNIWAGTSGGGVNRFRGGETPFLTYRKEPANPNSL